DLELVSGDLLGAEGAAVGRLGGQAADVVEQVAHLAQGAVGGGDDLVGPLRIGDGRVDAGDVAAKAFAGDQTGRVVLTGVNAETRAQALQSEVQVVVRPLQTLLSDQ